MEGYQFLTWQLKTNEEQALLLRETTFFLFKHTAFMNKDLQDTKRPDADDLRAGMLSLWRIMFEPQEVKCQNYISKVVDELSQN